MGIYSEQKKEQREDDPPYEYGNNENLDDGNRTIRVVHNSLYQSTRQVIVKMVLFLLLISILRSDTEEEMAMVVQSPHEHGSSESSAAQARRLEAQLDLNKERSRTQSSHAYEPVLITTDKDGDVCIDVHHQSSGRNGIPESMNGERSSN